MFNDAGEYFRGPNNVNVQGVVWRIGKFPEKWLVMLCERSLPSDLYRGKG